jgi:hypothetical protein
MKIKNINLIIYFFRETRILINQLQILLSQTNI